MLSAIIAWIAALFFLFMAVACFVHLLLHSEEHTPEHTVAGLGVMIVFLALSWAAAALGGV